MRAEEQFVGLGLSSVDQLESDAATVPGVAARRLKSSQSDKRGVIAEGKPARPELRRRGVKCHQRGRDCQVHELLLSWWHLYVQGIAGPIGTYYLFAQADDG